MAATQNQALNALLFLYREVLGGEMGWVDGFERAKRSQRAPMVLSQAEVRELLGQLSGIQLLIGQVLYGGGLRLMECLRLRVKDIDFARGQITVHGGKGDKDRATTMCEHPFGTIKRFFGYTCFLMKGLVKVRAEWSLMTLAYNLKRVLNLVSFDQLMAGGGGESPAKRLNGAGRLLFWPG